MKMFLVLVISVLILGAESRVVKSQQFAVPPEGITMDIIIRQQSGKPDAAPIATMKIDFNKDKVTLTNIEGTAGTVDLKGKQVPAPATDDVDDGSVLDRHGIRSGSCPLGYVMRTGFCFPDNDY